jgi:hypothetical protein
VAIYSFKEDYKRTAWKITLIYNLERSFAAGLTWIPLTLLVNGKTTASLLLLPLIYIMFLVPIRVLAYYLVKFNVPVLGVAAGLASWFCSLVVVVGDPLIYVLHKVLPPGYIPIEDPKLFHFDVIVYLTKPEGVDDPSSPDISEPVASPTPVNTNSADNFRRAVIDPLRTLPPSESVSGSGAPGFVESVMTKSLIEQAVLLEVEGGQESREKARALWEQALKIGGLSARDELLCHYNLGSYYQDREDLDKAIGHHERIAVSDPGLSFLGESDQTIVAMARDDFFKSLSAAYQFYSRTAIKEREGLEAATAYLERKVKILGDAAAPSVLLELGLYYGMAGNPGQASKTIRLALDAPDYGSEFQKKAKASALDFLREEAKEEPAQEAPKGGPKEEVKLQLGAEPKAAKPAAFKWVLGGLLAVSAVVALVVLLLPSAYKEYYKKAQESYNRGDFAGALTLANLAKEKKATADVLNLETEIRHMIQEQEARAERKKRQDEYDDLYRRAVRAFDQRNFAEADNFARLAAERMATPEINSLRSRIQRTRAEQEQAEQSRRLAEADDAAFQLANRLDTQAGYEEYLRSYPDGEYREAASRRISYLTRLSSQTQAAPPSSPVPVPETPQASNFASRPVQQAPRPREEVRGFSLSGVYGSRQNFEFNVVSEGQIRVEVRWTGGPRRLALILNGPGRAGYYQRRDGGSPMAVVQPVSRSILSRGTSWRVSIVNFNRGIPASGTIIITYPN